MRMVMPVDFFFEPATVKIKTLDLLRFDWFNIPDPESREIIVVEYQYLLFQIDMLNQLMFTKEGCVVSPPYKKLLSYDLRVGAIKAILLVASSIVEEALLSHAIKRNYLLPSNENERTFGVIIGAWREIGWKDIDERNAKRIMWLNHMRNNVHLHRIIKSKKDLYEQISKQEKKYLERVNGVIDIVSKIKS